MKYICHRDYDGKDMNGDVLYLKRGEQLDRVGEVLIYHRCPVCVWRSQIAKEHFACNDDGHGLERGDLTYAIAFDPRFRRGYNQAQQRFKDDEIEILNNYWHRFLRSDSSYLLFNDQFFEQKPELLRQVAKSVRV